MSGAPRFELDAAVRRRDGGRLLVGGTPPRLLRLSAAGGRALDAILAWDEPTGAAGALARRLERHGILHPLPRDGGGDPGVLHPLPGDGEVRVVEELARRDGTIEVDDTHSAALQQLLHETFIIVVLPVVDEVVQQRVVRGRQERHCRDAGCS